MTDKHNESDERIGAWERVADHPLFKECYAAESPLIDAMIAKLDDLDATRNEVNRLRDALSTNSDDDLCICITAGPALEGPDEYCLTHGRTKAEWMEKYDAAQRRVNELDPDPFAIPEAPKYEGCTIEEWAKQAEEFQKSNQRNLDAITSLQEQVRKAKAETANEARKYESAADRAMRSAREVDRLRREVKELRESVKNHKVQAEEYAEFADADTVTRFRDALVEIRGTAMGGDPKDRRLSLLVIWALAGQALEGGE